jgi:hypothetical protein
MQQVVFLHTMRNEHFGISLVEAMAAGSDLHANFAPRCCLQNCRALNARQYFLLL